jgi:hypothetical protein
VTGVDTETREPAWQAQVPAGWVPPAPRPRRGAYLGPPTYPAPPRWGFPRLAWRWPTSIPGEEAARRVAEPATLRRSALRARRCLAATAVVLLLAAAGEISRYVLLTISLHGRPPRGAVTASDALVATCGALGALLAAASLLSAARWCLPARRYAAEAQGRMPGRPTWQLVLGLVVPVVNLTVPFSVLAELEHDALARGPRERIRPSRLLRYWLGTWVLGGLLCWVTFAWSFRGGLAAEAHGMLWAAATALAAAAVAALTEVVVRRTTALLLPPERGTLRRSQVLRLPGGTPRPGEPQRQARPAGAPR